MFLLVNQSTKQILLSSARAFDLSSYPDGTVMLVEIPDEEYSPEMVGAVLHDE